MALFRSGTDRAWIAYGRDDPYFGVLAHEEYSRENLSDASLERFFQSGEDAVAELISSIGDAGIRMPNGRALDIGCGVGRLIIPLSTRFKEVVGVDVSRGMLDESARNIAKRRLTNISLCTTIPEQEFDFVHSVLVFQHIDANRGTDMIMRSWVKLAAGGVLAVQIPIWYKGTRARRFLRTIRDVFPMLQVPYNIIKRRPWDRPPMQMNMYDLNSLVTKLFMSGAKQVLLNHHDPDRDFCGVYVVAVK
jgi:SAM-dependent methyltransferase